jgi:hypothetical protein
VTILGNAPVAAPTITGTIALNQQLTALPNVNRRDDDTIGGSTYQWYRADTPRHDQPRCHYGRDRRRPTHHGGCSNKYLVFEVVPRTTTGTPNVGVATSTVTSMAVPADRADRSADHHRHLKTHEETDGVVNYDDAEDDAQGTHLYQCTPRPMRPAPTARRSSVPPATLHVDGAETGQVHRVRSHPVAVNDRPPASRIVRQRTCPGQRAVRGRHAVDVTGTWAVGEEITGHYQFADADNDAENLDGATFTLVHQPPDHGIADSDRGATGRTFTCARRPGQSHHLVPRQQVVSQTGTPSEGNRVPVRPPTGRSSCR